MFNAAALLSFSFLAGAYGQQVGTDTPEVHPTLTWQSCSAGGSCTNNQGSVVLDANWRFLHSTTDSTNCYSGNTWNTTLCPDPTTCATNCALDGANYGGTYGISSSGNALTLQFVTGTNVGSRVYLMALDDTNYHLFKLKNNEFAFDVQVSNLPCGVNGALYFTQMDADGGLSKFPTNKAGAKYGTGYCDAQCPQDIKFINGEANVIGWNGSNGAGGQFGACCNEMDIWEANSVSTAYTTHPCSVDGQYRCSGTACGYVKDGGICDKDGCDFNPYRLGDTSFYGKAFTVDTTNKMTVVTQFKTVDDTDTGALSEIRRFYVQDGKVIQNTKVNIPGLAADDSITAAFCKAQKVAFGNPDDFTTLGGLSSIDKALTKGVVLAMSIWDDYATDLLWLDSNFPASGDPNAPGIARGSCSITSGVPSQVEASFPDSSVTYSNIKFGPIGSTSTGPTTSRRSETASHGSRVRRQWLDRANSVH